MPGNTDLERENVKYNFKRKRSLLGFITPGRCSSKIRKKKKIMGWRRTKPAQYTEGKTQSQQHYWSEHPYLISGAWLRPRAHISEVPAQNPLLVLLAPHQHTGTATCAKGQYFGAWLLLSQESMPEAGKQQALKPGVETQIGRCGFLWEKPTSFLFS